MLTKPSNNKYLQRNKNGEITDYTYADVSTDSDEENLNKEGR